jgi:hypothetical protein
MLDNLRNLRYSSIIKFLGANFMLPSLTVPIAAIRGFFGPDLLTYQVQVKPDQVVQLLGHDPRSANWRRLPPDLRQIYEYLQRPTNKDRREGIGQYIETRLSPDAISVGAFPAISIGMVRPATFVQLTEDNTNPSFNAGTLNLELSDTNRRLMLDGLARVTAALDLIEEQPELLIGDWFSFPVTIYAPKEGVITLEQLGQLFHDFNFLQTRVTANQAIALDKSDPYIQITNTIGRSDTLQQYGGMEGRAASLGAKSTAVVVQRVLLRFVRGACEGRRFQESNLSRTDNPNLSPQTFQDIQEELENFIGDFADGMGLEQFKNRESLHLSAPGWQVLGLIFHDIKFRLGDRVTGLMRSDIIDRLAGVDWSRYNPDWIGLVGEPELDPVTQKIVTDDQGRQKVALSRAGRTTIAAILEYVRKKSGVSELLRELEETVENESIPEMERALVKSCGNSLPG